MKQEEYNKWINKAQEYTDAHVFEVGINEGVPTSQRWIELLFDKRYVNFKDYYEDQIEFKTKKEEEQFRKEFKEIWISTLNNYLDVLKKTKNEEEKERIRTVGVKRKVDSTSDKKKKKK